MHTTALLNDNVVNALHAHNTIYRYSPTGRCHQTCVQRRHPRHSMLVLLRLLSHQVVPPRQVANATATTPPVTATRLTAVFTRQACFALVTPRPAATHSWGARHCARQSHAYIPWYRYLQLAPLLLLTSDCCAVQHCIAWRPIAIPVAAATLGQKCELTAQLTHPSHLILPPLK